jgi:hypothetical protein
MGIFLKGAPTISTSSKTFGLQEFQGAIPDWSLGNSVAMPGSPAPSKPHGWVKMSLVCLKSSLGASVAGPTQGALFLWLLFCASCNCPQF